MCLKILLSCCFQIISPQIRKQWAISQNACVEVPDTTVWDWHVPGETVDAMGTCGLEGRNWQQKSIIISIRSPHFAEMMLREGDVRCVTMDVEERAGVEEQSELQMKVTRRGDAARWESTWWMGVKSRGLMLIYEETGPNNLIPILSAESVTVAAESVVSVVGERISCSFFPAFSRSQPSRHIVWVNVSSKGDLKDLLQQ